MTTKHNGTTTVLEIGDLVFFDTFSGLIPARLVCVNDSDVTVKLTATVGAYRRGETIRVSRSMCVPRGHIRRRKYSTTVFGVWTFAA